MSKRVKITTPSGEVYRFDIVPSQNVDEQSILTTYPVQNGTPITDHVYLNPVSVSMTVKVSDIKLSTYDNSFDDVNSRAERAKKIISDWRRNALLLKVQTKFDLYTNMVLVGVQNIVDSSRNSNVYEAVLTFQEIRIATIEEVEVGPFEDSAYESAYQNNGNVEGQVIEDEVVDSVGNAIGGAISGAALGTAIGGIVGSVIPGAGTIAGAVVGAGIGAVVGGAYTFLKSKIGSDS